MEKQDKDIMHVIKWIFAFMAAVVLLYFVLAECLLPPENAMSANDCTVFEGVWERVYPDGSRTTVTVPGKCEADRKEAVIVETLLPEDLDDGISICLRSSQQDMEIYVDGMLRQRYTTVDSRPFGKNSMSAYVFADLYRVDAGKTLRVITVSDSMYTGQLNTVYIGDRSGIFNYILRSYGVITLIDVMILLLSVIVIVASLLLRYVFHKDVVLNYLGWGVFWAALWMIAESKLRQFLLPNNSVFGSIAFCAVMIMPLPFLIYVDSIQGKRYHKWYKLMCLICITEFAACTLLQVCNIKDFIDTMVLMHGVLGGSFVLGAVTILLDWKRKKVGEYWLIAIGFLGVILTGSVEIIWVYQNTSHTRGIMICFGLLFLLAMSSIKTGRDLMKKEEETHIALQVGKSKADFLANMSHEIRTPINTVIGMNEMILRENQDKEIQKYAINIQRASDMLLALIDDVLDFSKIEAGHMEVIEAEYNLNDILKDVSYVLSSKAKEKELEAEIEIDETLPAILMGDEIRIKQILNNLVTNAVKYTVVGKVYMRVKGELLGEDTVCLKIDIEDTGIGIRQEDMSKLFESFTRLEQNKNRTIQGTGLGLSISKRLVELMNGELKVRSVYGKGSCFTVVIPQKILDRKMIREMKDNGAEENMLKSTAVDLYAPNASILVVDDMEMNLEVVRALLKRTGVQIDMAVSGRECLSHCDKKKYDLIFMDHMMPEMDGIQTLHILREEKERPNAETTVIALTANAIAGSKDMYLEEGFNDYISKPIIRDELEQMLDKYLPEELKEKRVVEELVTGTQTEPAETISIMEEEKKEEEPLMEQQELINKDSAMTYCCNSDEIYYDLLNVYVTQAKKNVEKLPAFYEKKDWENYKIIVHAIKSTSLTIGAGTLSEMAKEQEMAAKERNEAFIVENWEKFFAYYHAVIQKAEEMLVKNN